MINKTIKEYLEIVKSMSNSESKWRKYYGESSRGRWSSTETIMIDTTPEEIEGHITSERLHQIARMEVNIMDGGLDELGLYNEDFELLRAYQSLNTLKGPKPSSRNNVYSNPLCCLMTLHVLPDNQTLSVYQRSHDIKVAGKTDLLVIAILARRWGCSKIQYIDAHPHVYLDESGLVTSEIRRKKKQ